MFIDSLFRIILKFLHYIMWAVKKLNKLILNGE
jgi:hypothetical protein